MSNERYVLDGKSVETELDGAREHERVFTALILLDRGRTVMVAAGRRTLAVLRGKRVSAVSKLGISGLLLYQGLDLDAGTAMWTEGQAFLDDAAYHGYRAYRFGRRLWISAVTFGGSKREAEDECSDGEQELETSRTEAKHGG